MGFRCRPFARLVRVFLGLAVFAVLQGWSSDQARRVESREPGGRLSVEDITNDIIKTSGPRRLERIIPIDPDFVMVETAAPTLANWFSLYDLASRKAMILPTSDWFIRFIKNSGHDRFLFRSEGKESETPFRTFPFLIELSRRGEPEGEFWAEEWPVDFPLSERTTVGRLCPMLITDIRLTKGGFEIRFGPHPKFVGGFVADDSWPTLTEISHEEIGHQLVVDMLLAKPAPELPYTKIEKEHPFIRGISLEETEQGTRAIVSLKEPVRYYQGAIGHINDHNTPVLGLTFLSAPSFKW